jgi:2-methylcitrate dehydratase PrpD
MSVNLTNQFIDDLYVLSKADFPETVVDQAKRCLLDYLGAAFAGAQMMREKGEKLLACFGSAKDAAVIGFNRKAGLETAALLNGFSSHIAEFDDGVRFGMIHPGSPVFSALMPLAEKEKISGADFLKGVIIGYEAEVRLACAMQPSHYARGFHPTSTCGTIGAAMGAAAMLGLSKTEMKDTLSAAAVSAAGMLKVIEDGSEIKPLNVGRAAVNGLMAAFVGKAGFKGLEDVLSGDLGFFAMMAAAVDESKLSKVEREPFAIEKGYVKPYAACRHAHPAIEAALKIRAGRSIATNSVREIRVITYHGVLGKHDHTCIKGPASSKMSIPYGLAVALITGKAGIDQFNDEHVNDPSILALTKKVIVSADDKISALVPQQRAAIVEIQMNDGTCLSERVDYPKGEPENPLSEEELRDKFSLLAAYAQKSSAEIQKIIQAVNSAKDRLPELFYLL